ncbi:MAG: PKD domain-containing protein [bacterium]|nr:PKD domain-containing protein [bacterium]
MLERVRNSKAISSEGLGALLIFVGLVMFVVVFFVVFPVLSNPVGAYDEWFPADAEPEVTAEPTDGEESFAGPTAAFRFEAQALFEESPEGEEGGEGEERAEGERPGATYTMRLEDITEPGDGALETWTWDLGDGREARGRNVERTYEGPGVYAVRLDVTDSNGETSKVEGDVEIPEEGSDFGRIDAADDIDLSGIEAAVEDAVVALEDSVEETLDEVRSAARSTAVVVLFALAAIATTIVAWRVTRSGIMLLRPAQDVRLKVKSADMQVDVGRKSLPEAIEANLGDGETAPDLSTDLVEV